MKLYNSLSRQIEEFVPLNEGKVGMYTCGPTVYYYPQIGNWRTFVFEDVLRRALEYDGYEVVQVMNITDVGHLTGDNIGDADVGEDRMEKEAAKENKSAWEIAEFYIKDFIESRDKLNIEAPVYLPRATQHIPEQIALIERLIAKGLAYQTEKAVYFNVAKFPEYGKLGGQKLVDKRAASREELVEDIQKRHPYDFALWKFSPSTGSGLPKRQMEWESPWGVGFPGWHIECSAMSMKYLGDTFDIHTGGADHIAIHHANEIAQSEGATGKPLAKYWLHGAFLTVDGGRMGKSLGNAYSLHEVEAKGFSPINLRYFYFSGHYRKQLNFTWEAMATAQKSLQTLKEIVVKLKTDADERTVLSEEKLAKIDGYRLRFKQAVDDDLNMPKAVAVMWETAKSNIPSKDKLDLLMDFDRVLGLGMGTWHTEETVVPMEITKLSQERQQARERGNYELADGLRQKIQELGYEIEDVNGGARIKKKEAYVR